jgi:hypothetical protein
MSMVKDACKLAMQKLGACAGVCEKFVKGEIPKNHCIPPARDAASACKKTIEALREHLKSCKNDACIACSNLCIKACEKAVEKSNACADACGGGSSDGDCKTVCKDCADACRACLKACQDCMSKAC